MTDSREYRRFPVHAEVRYAEVEADGATAKWHTAPVLDLSAKGLRFLGKKVAVGKAVELSLALPTGRVAASARVVRVDPAGSSGRHHVGVEFTRISDLHRDEIVRFLFQRQASIRLQLD